MRAQQILGEKLTDGKYELIKQECNQHRLHLEKQLIDYKQELVDFQVKKKNQQTENGQFWLQQMNWRQQKADRIKDEDKDYDPEAVWNIEGPLRRRMDAAKRKALNEDLKKVNAQQREMQTVTEAQRQAENLATDKQLIERDRQGLDLDRQVQAFKKQLFRQEMTDAWSSQNKYKQNMKTVEHQF